jgi:A/G-specific adenine glycosylase
MYAKYISKDDGAQCESCYSAVMTEHDLPTFQQTVWQYYEANGRRDLPWRQAEAAGLYDPYKIVVSELMLQQTQVPRVVPKFNIFIKAFPSFEALAEAPLSEVLQVWSGLGYNRRAKFLRQTAQVVAGQYGGNLPHERADLVAMPGIGFHTAGAVLAYAYNEPAVFIETNIRTVFIHHFFPGQEKVSDADLLPMIEQSLPEGRAREWYWALMDYGTHLKQNVGNAARLSASYSKQSKFHGSRRQIRGQVLRLLGRAGAQTLEQLQQEIADERLASVLDDLANEGFIESANGRYGLSA